MAYQIIKSDEPLPDKSLVVVIYAPPGSWKTSLAFTSKKPFLFDFDDGLHRAVGRKDAIKFESWNDVIDFCDSQDFKDIDPDTLIFDTAGSMLDEYIAQAVMDNDRQNKRAGGQLSIQGYGAMKSYFDSFLARFRGKKDLIFICHETEDKKLGDKSVVRPKMTGGAYSILIAKADLIGYMNVSQNDQKETTVTLDFNPTDERYAKNFAQFDPLPLPHYSSDDWNGYMDRLICSGKEKMQEMSEKQREALAFVKEQNEVISLIKDIPGLESLKETYKSLSKTYQMQLHKSLHERHLLLLSEFIDSIESYDQLCDYMESAFEKESNQIKGIIIEKIKDKAAETWVKKFISKDHGVDDYNSLIEVTNDVDKLFQKKIKLELISVADKAGFVFVKEKVCFEAKPSKPSNKKNASTPNKGTGKGNKGPEKGQQSILKEEPNAVDKAKADLDEKIQEKETKDKERADEQDAKDEIAAELANEEAGEPEECS